MESSKDNDVRVSLLALVSACADASSRGCQIIRHVHHKRISNPKPNPNSNSKPSTSSSSSDDGKNVEMKVEYKIADDPRSALTEADGAAQAVIIGCLRNVWGESINIVGEEDDGDHEGSTEKEREEKELEVFRKYGVAHPKDKGVDLNSFDLVDIGEVKAKDLDTEVNLEDVTLYVDPMDGTREFVEGRLSNVQCLIGIVHKGKPIAGVTGLPFFHHNEEQNEDHGIHVLSAICHPNCTFVKQLCCDHDTNSSQIVNDSWSQFYQTYSQRNKSEDQNLSNPDATSQTVVYTSDSRRPLKTFCLQNLTAHMKDFSTELTVRVAGGCGNKIVNISSWGNRPDRNRNALGIITPGTCSWDTASSTALLLATVKTVGREGKVTDMLGGELVYDPSGKNYTNDLGVLVSFGEVGVRLHDDLTRRAREDGEVLGSLVKRYWGLPCGSTEAFKDVDGQSMFHRARRSSQAFDEARNSEGYIMTCTEIQIAILEQIDFSPEERKMMAMEEGEFELDGYAIPEKGTARRGETGGLKSTMYLHWKRSNSGKRRKLEDGDDGDGEKVEYSPPENVMYIKVVDEDTFDTKVLFSLVN